MQKPSVSATLPEMVQYQTLLLHRLKHAYPDLINPRAKVEERRSRTYRLRVPANEALALSRPQPSARHRLLHDRSTCCYA